MQLSLLNLAIDSKLKVSDLLKLHVYEVSSQGVIYERVQCIQQKTGTDVHYEITPRTQQSISRWIYSASLEASSFLFPSCRRKGQPISYSFYRSIIMCWAVKLGGECRLLWDSFNASHQSYFDLCQNKEY